MNQRTQQTAIRHSVVVVQPRSATRQASVSW